MKLTAAVKTAFCVLFLSFVLGVTVKAQEAEITPSVSIPSSEIFVRFEALKFGNNIELKWRAASNGKGGEFIIERSVDGVKFEKIGTATISKAAGTFNYVFADRSPLEEKSFYRIRIADNNATQKISPVATVDFKESNLYAAYPTSTNSLIFIKVPKETKIAIYNNQGVVVKTLVLKASQNIDVTDLDKGMYQVHFEGAKESVRFIKM